MQFLQNVCPHGSSLVKKKGGSAQCINCRVDYCEDCVQKYAKLIDNIEILTCDKKIYSSIFS